MTEDEISWADPLGPNEPEAAPAQPYFANVDEFVRLYLLPNWRRNTLHARWCVIWGSTPKRSPASKRSGSHGSDTASSQAPAWPSGGVPTPTPTWPC